VIVIVILYATYHENIGHRQERFGTAVQPVGIGERQTVHSLGDDARGNGTENKYQQELKAKVAQVGNAVGAKG
jgi:hypothetical protein